MCHVCCEDKCEITDKKNKKTRDNIWKSKNSTFWFLHRGYVKIAFLGWRFKILVCMNPTVLYWNADSCGAVHEIITLLCAKKFRELKILQDQDGELDNSSH